MIAASTQGHRRFWTKRGGKMELFLDTASYKEIEIAHKWGVISGVTTNPTLAAKENENFYTLLKKICNLVPGPISAEVLSQTSSEMVKEGLELAKIAPNVVIKIPVCSAGLTATKELSAAGIKVNMTLVFTLNQALLAAAAGAAYVSPFLGRLDDIGENGIEMLEQLIIAFNNYQIGTKIIAASIRHPVHVCQAALLGTDIATVPFSVLQKMIEHPLTAKGIQTFNNDWQKLQAKLGNKKAVAEADLNLTI